MSRMPTLNSPFLLGFDEIERALERVTRSTSDGYPPYNIERLARTESTAETLRITLAVAGFTRDQLEILVEDGQLVIRADRSTTRNASTCIAGSPRDSSSASSCSPTACRWRAPTSSMAFSPSISTDPSRNGADA